MRNFKHSQRTKTRYTERNKTKDGRICLIGNNAREKKEKH